MEQWVVDGRQVIQERGFGRVPYGVEEKGFDLDLSGGNLRGLLLRRIGKEEISDYTKTWCPFEENPKQNTECVIKVAYLYDGALADVNGFTKQELASLKSGEYAEILKDVPEWEEDSLEPLKAVVGAGQVIQGVEEALMQMKAGEIVDLYLDPGFAFRGDILKAKLPGCKGIPPDSAVIVVLQLVSYEHEPTEEQKVERGERLKAEGNQLLGKGDISGAIQAYHNAFEKMGGKRAAYRYKGGDPEFKKRDVALRSGLFNNLAICWSKKENKPKVLEFCNKALEENPQHVKARFRRSGINEQKLEFEAALKDLYYLLDSKLLELTETEKAEIEVAVQRIQGKDSSQTNTQNQTYKKMFWAASGDDGGSTTDGQ